MVEIRFPPPEKKPNPLYQTLSAGDSIMRIFDPTEYNTQSLTFRYVGAINRFDHHRKPPAHVKLVNKKKNLYEDSERGIYYAGLTLSCCLVECFGDSGVIDFNDKHICLIKLDRDLTLLDIKGNGAMRAGSVAALSKIADRDQSQEWSRYFYEDKNNWYGKIDGISYLNAHNDGESFALYERAKSALIPENTQSMRLDDPNLRAAIQEAALQNHLYLQL